MCVLHVVCRYAILCVSLDDFRLYYNGDLIMKKCESVALNFMLCDYPENITFSQVLDLIYEEDESISIWEPFENHPPLDIIQIISDMRDTLQNTYGE